jgi:hypothetical protein
MVSSRFSNSTLHRLGEELLARWQELLPGNSQTGSACTFPLERDTFQAVEFTISARSSLELALLVPRLLFSGKNILVWQESN